MSRDRTSPNPSPDVSLDEAAALALAGTGLIVALDQVVDPHNVGAIFRAAAAFDVDAVVMHKDRSSPLTDAARRVSQGGADVVPHVSVTNLVRALEKLKKQGFWILGTTLGPGSSKLAELEVPRPAVLVMGSEQKGLRRLVAEKCDLLATIPMSEKMQSLNVSQAAAVTLYELRRRDGEAGD